MKILFFGDSITDAGRMREEIGTNKALGVGFVRDISSMLLSKSFDKYEIINTGISGNRIVDLYSRIKIDLWNHEPDVISILIGINDIWHEIQKNNGVEIDRFESMYRLLLKETKERLPNAKIILCEPFVLPGTATDENYDRFLEVKEYAAIVARLAEEFDAEFVKLQDELALAGEKYGNEKVLRDGVHPGKIGAVIIAREWVKAFEKIEN